MKVVDLLVKIANDEEVPKKIKVYSCIWNCVEEDYNYKNQYNAELFGDIIEEDFLDHLGDEIEKIYDDKKIEKLIVNKNKLDGKWKNGSSYNYTVSMPQQVIIEKINEIIDVINENNM